MESSDQLKLLHDMMRVRRMEELCAELYTQEKIRGFLHLSIGEEAIASGVMSLLKPNDNVMATYREHGHALLKGVSAKLILAEMYGKAAGCSRGRGGSMHLFCKEKRFFGGNAIVAAGIPQAVGLGLAAKYLKEDRHTVCFFGEGAVAEGVFHESLNMAQLWKIPVLFCCENNLYAMGTSIARSQAEQNLLKKAQAHNVASLSVDGMDVFEVRQKTQEALDFISHESKPYFLEFRTYRFRAHSMFDPELYRSKEEVRRWRERDPIQLLKDHLDKNFLMGDKFKDLETDVEKEMQEAVEYAESCAVEPVEDLEKHLYENNLSGSLERRA